MPKNQGFKVDLEPKYYARKDPIERTFFCFFQKFGNWKGKV